MARANHVPVLAPLLGILAVVLTAAPRTAVPSVTVTPLPAAVRPTSAPRVSNVRPPSLRRPAVAAGPLACFAAKSCPGIHAEICFAGAVAGAQKTSSCPTRSGRYEYAVTPPPRR